MKATSANNRVLILLAFAAIYLIWGSTYLAISWAVKTLPPFLMMGTRFVIAGLLIFGFGLMRSRQFPSRQQWAWAGLAGVLMILVDYGAISWAEQYVPSGVTSVVFATTPIWLVLFDQQQRTQLLQNWSLSGGILAGLVGVGLISWGSYQTTMETGHQSTYILGMGALLIASLSWAVGTMLYRDRNTDVSVPIRMGMQMLVGGSLLVTVSGLVGEWHGFSVQQVSTSSWLSLLYLITFGTLVAHTAYLWLLQVQPPALVGTYAYVNPIIALILGWWLGNEPLTIIIGTATLIILAAVLLIKRAGNK
ncbi:EamA family transporter [Fibrella forsythiae]|uniref:EamA family transporter n=1 Tax=Fibrella forsythiae TaxID=2817061 RepID=A0ABS3JPH7_9BACT|nr:EamA family transporter [Fibrella forsythiae]MBO0951908.1 EamA family transporter [Fibrella forsythiae]